MDQDKVAGMAKKAAGNAEEGLGRAVGDAESQVAGKARRAEGAAQETYGRAKESMEDTVRDCIENRPYTTAAIALAVGWLIGRSHRPL
ncbi:MAG TPA: CsbD family protein [Xanthobacteraceae bacterium]|jgi:uncharacterized protein YjbJ (UPF0337 family)|nr:CsbD family protein [Xanthobacteraceae bacterium]